MKKAGVMPTRRLCQRFKYLTQFKILQNFVVNIIR
ncbi:hypothetical protein AAUPMC_02699, partial [Pasteurella multocida subsp. multocida str. Anand1_cattle]